eukprot:gene8302-10181_t
MGYFKQLHRAVRDASSEARSDLSSCLRSAGRITRTSICGAPRLVYFFSGSAKFYQENLGVLRKELFSGFTIAVLQIPESVAFSFVAGLDPIIGLRATVFMALVCGLLGARPGMVSGAAGAMAVIVADLSGSGGRWNDRDPDEVNRLVYMTLILTGVFQCAIAVLGLARFSNLIPFTAMIGFLNGLAIIILISQLDAFKECPGDEYGVCARAGTLKWMSISDGKTWMAIVEVVLAALTVYIFPKWKTVEKYIPAALVALIVVTAFEHGINRPLIDLPTRIVKETANVEGKFITPGIPKLPDDTPWDDIVTYAVILALVGVIESVMTSDAVAEVLQEPNGKYASTQDSFAQGMGNFVSGLFGSMGGDAMIGQSLVNVSNGARCRLSTISSGAFLAIVIVALPSAIGLVPVSCLTGILFIIVFKTFYWNSFILLFRLNWADSLTIVGVTLLAVLTNLAIAVGAGVVWRALVHSVASSTLLHVHSEEILPDTLTPPLEATSEESLPELDTYSNTQENKQLVFPKSNNIPVIDGEKGYKNKEQQQIAGITVGPHVADAVTSSADMTNKELRKEIRSAGEIVHEENHRMQSSKPQKIYYLSGPLFFGSVTTFRTAFTPAKDPSNVVIDLTESLVSDFSGVAAIRAVCKRYQQLQKTIAIRGLSARSQSHMRRQPKLQPLTESATEPLADGGDEERAQMDSHKRRILDGENLHYYDDEDDDDECELADGGHTWPALTHLRMFRPQGDELHHPDVEITGTEAAEVLRAAGIDLIDENFPRAGSTVSFV